MKTLYRLLLLVVGLTILNCSGGGGGEDPIPTPVTPPSAATLVFPLNNSECTEGSNITSTQSTISFDWSDAANTDSYQLVLKNLETQSINTYNSNSSALDIAIAKGTPFSWHIISKSNGTTETAQSATWKFYNAGDAITSYAPFPAELVAPSMGANLESSVTNVTLDWVGSDVDNDITEYEILFGTDSPPSTSLGTTASSNWEASVATGNTYYWRVITKDSQNNSSNSEIFQFKVN